MKQKPKRSPRLTTIAKAINASGTGYTATIERGHCNTDRHPKGVRWRIPGKGREGNEIIIRDPNGNIVKRHNAAETYRRNSEVVEWARVNLGIVLPKP